MRDAKGRFTHKHKLGFWFLIISFGLLVSYITYTSSEMSNQITAENIVPVIATPVFAGETMESKVEGAKDAIIEDLAKCESGNAPQDMAIVKYDNNSKSSLTGKNIASIGVMQFKISTVQQFYKDLHGKELTNYEATLLALDNTEAKKLAKQAIFGLKGALFHWTCATQDMAARVTFIKELEG